MLRVLHKIRLSQRRFQNLFSTEAAPSPLNTDKESNEEAMSPPTGGVSKYFRDLVYKGRKSNRLALRDLRKLMEQCQESNHVRFALLGLELYQRKGQDFSEEVGSHFIKACIRTGHPARALDPIRVYKNRIGAWMTQTSFNNLISNINVEENLEAVVDALEVVVKKGLRPSLDSITSILRASVSVASSSSWTRIVAVAENILTSEEASHLIESCPQPPVVEVESEPLDDGTPKEKAEAS